jgi:hypothetical protein
MLLLSSIPKGLLCTDTSQKTWICNKTVVETSHRVCVFHIHMIHCVIRFHFWEGGHCLHEMLWEGQPSLHFLFNTFMGCKISDYHGCHLRLHSSGMRCTIVWSICNNAIWEPASIHRVQEVSWAGKWKLMFDHPLPSFPRYKFSHSFHFYHEDGGSRYFKNVSNLYHTTQCHFPEDHPLCIVLVSNVWLYWHCS